VSLPLVACVMAVRARGAPARRGRTRPGWLVPVAAGVAVLAAFCSLLPPYLSVLFTDRGFDRAPSDLAGAFRDFDRARSANPAALQPHLAEGTVAVRHDRMSRARRAFERSIEEEDNWYAHFELALLDAHTGRFDRARRELRRASELNSSDPLLRRIGRRIAARERLDPAAVNRSIERETRARFRRQ
jgi:tetratricopeptide (TPR) repeat protein